MFRACLVEIEGGRRIASCMLASCLGQEVFISLDDCLEKLNPPLETVLLLLTNRLHLLFSGERRQGYGAE